MEQLDRGVFIPNSDEIKQIKQTQRCECPGSTEEDKHDMAYYPGMKPEMFCPKCKISVPLFPYVRVPRSRLTERLRAFERGENPEPKPVDVLNE